MLIAACAPGVTPSEAVPTAEEHQVQLPAVGAGNDQEAVQQPNAPVDTAQPTETGYPSPVEVIVATQVAYPEPEPVVQPSPRPVMEATDPSTVSLASGQLQLVEFFAFW